MQKGETRNYQGRPRRYWITEKRRYQEAKKSFEKLCEIRDAKLYEQTVEFVDGEAKTVDVVPSVKEVRESCKLIMAYSVGQPKQEVELTGNPDKPIEVKSVDGFDWQQYAALLGAVSYGKGSPASNGIGESVYSPYANGETSGLLEPPPS